MNHKLIFSTLKEIGKDFYGYIVIPAVIAAAVLYLLYTIAYLIVFFAGNAPEASSWLIFPGALMISAVLLYFLYAWVSDAVH